MSASNPRTTKSAETAAPTIVLIGHGMVGQRFLEALAERKVTETARVVVFCEEPRPAYDRVQLTSYFSGRTPDELSLVEEGFMARHGIELRLGDPAQVIDRDARTVTSRSGLTVAYDTLVLATGSYPFVPPVPGKDSDGCFVYRTVEDLLAIEEYAGNRSSGIVVGGGLLGLEAAGALRGLGLTTHIVEFNPRLMAIQVDEGGGAALRRTVEDMGLIVHTGVGGKEITADADGAVTAMTLSDGSSIETDLVIFSAGVRPRDQLARDCGLDVGERGGIAVDAACRTSDPAVYAIGECALAADGRVYGLVAPGYEMAEVAAREIADSPVGEGFTGADTSTKLKLLGVDVASFGDAHGTADGCLDVVYSDSRTGVYKKLVVGADGALLGGVLVGDAEAYGMLRPLTGSVPPVSPEQLVLPAGLGAPAALGPSALPDEAVICNCHNVTKGAIRSAVTDHHCTSVPEVKKCTKAGTGCGSCVKALTSLVNDELEAGGVSVDKGLCGCFAYTRAELYEIVRTLRITTYAQLLDSHGRAEAREGDGCEVCKPAVASIIASLAPTLGASGYVLDGEQAALQDTNDHFLANLQRNGSYSIVPRIPGGEITPEKLIVIGEVARDFGLYTKITGGQRIDLFGARVDQLPLIWTRLVDAGFESGHAYGKALRTVKSCVGQTWCRYGVQDSVRMAIDLELRYRGLRSPHKLKSAVSGCARECAEARGKDFGVIATSNGWNLYVGGNGGADPRHADLLAQDLDDKELIRLIDRFLMFYIRTADRLERTSAWLERIEGGLDHVREVVVEDSLGLCAELEAMMADHVTGYRDEWAETLGDPERLRRFVSFVNAPGAADPTVKFVPERDQVKPDLTILSGPTLPVRTLEGTASR
ncbi:nitrite reductase large subunit NirB [Streptomyces rapamycinicus]|uniref:assimilatory sulfite reductase (ferredoxin) n=2 Tax=Streptomyces rapamycinicus TaxID=1226757 RepID=A0A0A0NM30_STRRN|nr:nitrite reductase large subunit NirB [Streptomyces rapamycinicus]AGP58014.1 nitrite reductase [Streptomyces rapamycinicus NRRL 5491]MBB4785686.1 nitrite reductase (NADH) large subunit [Streptomyces rapamycinicus]RLV78849.1 nitrite reductase [Streptomyces rapamycinicus NRRL 5491]UTO65849.1 nitrite reductase large subunit NirB [Streptomyces rapamycinicus]UTP33804.1 nitrite reductase large subunit NirB [Streptomyces rapamycinicus NRRL 5491]